MNKSLRDLIRETIVRELDNPKSDLGAKIDRDCCMLIVAAKGNDGRLNPSDLSIVSGGIF